MKPFKLFALIFLFASVTSLAQADCTPITSLPYTIGAPGQYCLTSTLTTVLTQGAAISIGASDVVLDLQGHAIEGSGAADTSAFGILASGALADITVRNGIVRGFSMGVILSSTNGLAGHVVENIRAEGNTTAGIKVFGPDCSVHDNQVVATGGTNVGSVVQAIVVQGARARVLDNDVIGFDLTTGPGTASGVLVKGSQALIERNRVVGATSYGILIVDGSTQVAVSDNRVQGGTWGIAYEGTASGKYRDNLVAKATTSYKGGTNVGGNN
jgi:hypothetical protein